MSARLLALSRPFVALAITLTSSSLAAQSTAPAHFPARPIVKPPPYPDAPALWLRAMRLAPADPTVDGVFGQTVAVDGDTLVARQRGNAYVFVRDGNGNWNQQAKLVPPNVDTSSDETVALDGDNLVIGRPQDEGNFSYSHGTAYTYHRTGTSWALEHASTGLAVGQVGYDVAMVGDLSCITGILTKDPIFFRRRVGTSWVVEATIGCCPSGGGGIRSIAMDDSWFVVASHPWVPTSSAGKLHFYRRDGSGWTHVQTFDAPNATENDLFGNDTALSDKFVVVGAVRHDMFGTDVGAAFVYERIHAGWQSHAVLGPCNPGEREFGRSVAILGSTIVVTAQQRTDVEEVQEYRSVAHVFEQTPSGWALRQTLTIPETPYANGLGASVALDAQTIAIGSKSEDQPVPNAGAVYTFEKSAALGGNFCFGDGSGTACPCNNPGQAGSGCANAYSAVGARLDAY
ncbi:MAG: FG-GAP repeat protein, partial [Planctomycetota bacterium]